MTVCLGESGFAYQQLTFLILRYFVYLPSHHEAHVELTTLYVFSSINYEIKTCSYLKISL